MLVVIASWMFLAEVPTPVRLSGVLLICAGVLTTAWDSLRQAKPNGLALSYALANSALIAAYTLADGSGVRCAGTPLGYIAWTDTASALAYLGWTAWRTPHLLHHSPRRDTLVGVAAGFGSFASYGLAIWAMRGTPLGVVSALRETSILFATVLAVWLLRERMGWRRVLAVCLIVAGVTAIQAGAAGPGD
jgi:drug/metabolite transporter (DMT)-like permease